MEPPQPVMVNIQELLDYEANAIKNRIWYRGDSYEIQQLYDNIAQGNMIRMFWASRPTPGMELHKLHTGIPAVIIDTLTGIVADNVNDFEFQDGMYADIWEEIAKENEFKQLLTKAVAETLYIGDGAWKISFDPQVSEYPLLEFFPGDRTDYTIKHGRITEITFKTIIHGQNGRKYELHEIYGMGYINYELYRDGNPCELSEVDELSDLRNVVFGSGEDPYMLAVRSRFFPSGRWEGRGQSVFDRKIENFDALDEAWSQWMDALRAGRSKTYIPESLIPRDPETGVLHRPNPFDNRFIATESDMSQNGQNKIITEQPSIPTDSYIQTYTTALDQSLQGLVSPSTLGIDIKKLDNAEAQREKEKVTLYTRSKIVEALQETLKKLAETAIRGYFEAHRQSVTDIKVDVTFGDYANPSFESQIETIGKAKTQGIMSIDTCVDELYGDSRDDEWKRKEVQRIKNEAGVVDLEEPAVNLDAFSSGTLPVGGGKGDDDDDSEGGKQDIPDDEKTSAGSPESGK